jgi:hypothetical protein
MSCLVCNELLQSTSWALAIYPRTGFKLFSHKWECQSQRMLFFGVIILKQHISQLTQAFHVQTKHIKVRVDYHLTVPKECQELWHKFYLTREVKKLLDIKIISTHGPWSRGRWIHQTSSVTRLHEFRNSVNLYKLWLKGAVEIYNIIGHCNLYDVYPMRTLGS